MLASASILACDCGPAGFSSGKSSCEGQIMTECPTRCLGRPVCCEQTDMRIRALTVKKDALNCTLQRFQRAPETKLRHMLATTTVCKTTQLGLKEALRCTKLPEVVCMDCKKKNSALYSESAAAHRVRRHIEACHNSRSSAAVRGVVR